MTLKIFLKKEVDAQGQYRAMQFTKQGIVLEHEILGYTTNLFMASHL